jgi:hypothetical protein
MVEENPLDELEFLDETPDIQLYSAFTIKKDHRNYMIICVSLLMIHFTYLGVSELFPHLTTFSLGQNRFVSVLMLVVETYYYYFLFNYFKHYQLNFLKNITLFMMVADAGSQLTYLANTFEMYLPEVITSFFSLLAFVCLIIWIILVLRLDKTQYSAIPSLKKSAKLMIASIVVAGLISGVTLFSEDLFMYYGLTYLPIVIPYIFIIEFTLKLKSKD